MHVREFAYARACDHICHRMRVYILCARLHACAVERVGMCA